MAITPHTNLKLLKCNLNLDNSNQLNFISKTTQYNYFNSLTKIEASNFTYQRKDNVIRYPAHIDTIIEYNYCMYQNSNYTNKWFYAYITRMEYVNDNMTYIYIKTDTFQTWQFDITFMRSFVEREHVNNDTKGLHTVPENLELGEYVYDFFSVQQPTALKEAHPVVATTVKPDGGDTYGDIYGGVYSGYKYYIFHNNSDLQDFIMKLNTLSKVDGIKAIFMAPDELTNYDNITQWDTTPVSSQSQTNIEYKECSAPSTPFLDSIANIVVAGTNGLYFSSLSDVYIPKNAKLYTYPYNFFCITNSVGDTGIFHYEDFANPDYCKFSIYGTLSVGCSIKAVPINYKNLGLTSATSIPATNLPMIEGIVCAKYPTCSWDTDPFTNWLTQNAVNMGISLGTSALGIATGFATGNILGVGSGIVGVASSVGQIYQHDLMPPQLNGSVSAGDINFTMGYNGFAVYRKHLRKEYCEIIDNFWSMYGYKVNVTKVPNLTGRTNWNYVKCIDVNIEGYIPQEDLQELKGMFNEGVTIWHKASTFLDYSQSNAII